MRHQTLLWLTAVACASLPLSLALSLPCCLAEQPADRSQEIDKLIAQLGSSEFETREDATRLLKQREDAAPALRRALKSPDREVARRAQEILDSFAAQRRKQALARLADLAKSGPIDQMVEAFVGRTDWDDETRCWEVVADVLGRLRDGEQRADGKSFAPSDKVLLRPDDVLPTVLRDLGIKTAGTRSSEPKPWKGRIVLRAEEILRAGDVTFCLVAVSGKTKTHQIGASVVFAGDSIDVDSGIHHSVVVCDGDVTVGNVIRDSLIIARGAVRCDYGAYGSRVIMGGQYQSKRPDQIQGSKIVEKESKPLGFVKFFDPADVGIKVETADGGVRVKEAAKDKRFAAAGLRADDLVTTINGDAVKDAEGFRRQLRARLAVEEEIVLKVRRDRQTLEVRVPSKE
jgi:hypothetical protein